MPQTAYSVSESLKQYALGQALGLAKFLPLNQNIIILDRFLFQRLY